MKKLSLIMQLTKPRLSLMVFVTAFIGMYLTPYNLEILPTVMALVGIYLLVSAACALNCFIEIDEDSKMDRTKTRPLVTEEINPVFAFFFGVSLWILSMMILYFYSNTMTMLLGLIAFFTYLFVYTPLKKKTPFAVWVGAIPGALPPLMGHTTVMNDIDIVGISLFSLLFMWQLPHFLAISLYNKLDYLKAGFKIYPNSIGNEKTKKLILIYTAILVLVPFVAFSRTTNQWFYSFSIICIGLVFFLYSVQGLIKKKEDENIWAKKYFLGSLIYLPTILVWMVWFIN
ncbi:heme o synthase [Bacteriovoracaceae bacterium]|nr:heme o synthase [Bacteriovoracaceae bacterium]